MDVERICEYCGCRCYLPAGVDMGGWCGCCCQWVRDDLLWQLVDVLRARIGLERHQDARANISLDILSYE